MLMISQNAISIYTLTSNVKGWWNSYCYISSIKAINVGVRMKRYDGCQKEFVRRNEWWDIIEKALDAESILGSAPAPAFENFSRGFLLLAEFRNLGFGVMPRNFSILGAIKERVSYRTIMKFMHHDIILLWNCVNKYIYNWTLPSSSLCKGAILKCKMGL